MMRKLIIGLAIVFIPLGVWYAYEYGRPLEVAFSDAIVRATTSSESEQAPKVVIVARVLSLQSDHDLLCSDTTGTEFRIEYTGSPNPHGFASNKVYRFLGHVHDGAEPYFHATQWFE